MHFWDVLETNEELASLERVCSNRTMNEMSSPEERWAGLVDKRNWTRTRTTICSLVDCRTFMCALLPLLLVYDSLSCSRSFRLLNSQFEKRRGE